jgi:hypothetical protein
VSKGSSQPAGQTNVTNPAQVAQQPYLNYGYQEAKNLYQNNPQTYYPGQTLAPWMAPDPAQRQGYQNLYSTGSSLDEWLRPSANQVFGQAVTGQMGNAANPATPYYQGYAQGTSPVSQNFQGLQQGAQQGGQQYAQAVGQYAPQMQQTGQQAYGAGSQYAQMIGGYATPLAGYGYQAGANNNLGLSQLGKTASGEYLNSNPYMVQMVQSAMDPVTRNYQTSIAPGLDAAAAASGRYGSGAQANQASTAQQNLTRGLSDLSGNLYGQQYARERQAQDAAAQNYGQLYNAGLGLGMEGMRNAAGLLNQAGGMYMSGADRALSGLGAAANTQNAAGNQFWEGQRGAQTAANAYGAANQYGITGLGSGFNQGNQNMLEAMRQYPQLAQAQFLGPQQQIQAGQGLTGLDQTYRSFLQAQIDDERKRYEGNQMAPYNTLDAYMQSIGNPQQGSTSTPYYRNQGAEIMSGITGAVGLGRTLLAPMTGGLSKI